MRGDHRPEPHLCDAGRDPLAGIVHFAFSREGDALLFEILIYARAANPLDQLALGTVGDGMQDGTWRTTVQRVVDLSGGTARGGVRSDSESVGEADAARLDQRVEELILARRRARDQAG